MKKTILVMLMMLLVHSVCFANEIAMKALENNIDSLHDIPEPITIVPNVTASMDDFTSRYAPIDPNKQALASYYFCKVRRSAYDPEVCAAREITGFKVTFENDSDKFYSIQWSGSNMTFGDFSGIPLLGGMNFTDAGKPNATPDTLLPPRTRTTVMLYTSNVEYRSTPALPGVVELFAIELYGAPIVDEGWVYNGQFIPANNSMQLVLNLKLTGNNNSSNYYSVRFPHIGLRP